MRGQSRQAGEAGRRAASPCRTLAPASAAWLPRAKTLDGSSVLEQSRAWALPLAPAGGPTRLSTLDVPDLPPSCLLSTPGAQAFLPPRMANMPLILPRRGQTPPLPGSLLQSAPSTSSGPQRPGPLHRDVYTLVTASYSYGEPTLWGGLVRDQRLLRTGHVTQSGPMRFNPGTWADGGGSHPPRRGGREQELQAPSLPLCGSLHDPGARVHALIPYPAILPRRPTRYCRSMACDFRVHERHQGSPHPLPLDPSAGGSQLPRVRAFKQP